MSLSQVELRVLLEPHNLKNETLLHTDVDVRGCACRAVVARPPQSSGNACHDCGGIMVQTGTCTTCTGCGNTGGCG